jgi:hypothetical protein
LEKGSDFVEGASFRETVMPKISVSIILIRVEDPLKSANFFNDRHVGFEVILAVTIRIMLVLDMTLFNRIKCICFFFVMSVPVHSTAGQGTRLQKRVVFLCMVVELKHTYVGHFRI